MARLIDDVFKNQRFIPEQMSEFGFQKIEGTYTYEESFLDDSFRAVVTVKTVKSMARSLTAQPGMSITRLTCRQCRASSSVPSDPAIWRS